MPWIPCLSYTYIIQYLVTSLCSCACDMCTVSLIYLVSFMDDKLIYFQAPGVGGRVMSQDVLGTNPSSGNEYIFVYFTLVQLNKSFYVDTVKYIWRKHDSLVLC